MSDGVVLLEVYSILKEVLMVLVQVVVLLNLIMCILTLLARLLCIKQTLKLPLKVTLQSGLSSSKVEFPVLVTVILWGSIMVLTIKVQGTLQVTVLSSGRLH